MVASSPSSAVNRGDEDVTERHPEVASQFSSKLTGWIDPVG